jgi:hypothetical protein
VNFLNKLKTPAPIYSFEQKNGLYLAQPTLLCALILKKLNLGKMKQLRPICNLNFFFSASLAIAVTNFNKKIIFHLRPPLFARIIGNKKAMRRSRILTTVLVKTLRKSLILLSVKALQLKISGKPFSLSQWLRILFTPLLHKFWNPFTQQIIDEEKTPTPPFPIYSYFFQRQNSYCFRKLTKAGRIKRKIRRKLISKL